MTLKDIKQICQIYDNLRRERDNATIAYNSEDTFWEHVLVTYNLSQPSLPDNLDEAAEEYRQGEVDSGCDYIDDSDGDSLYHSACLADAFIAGAEWQAEKCDEETSKLLYAERQTAYINGWDDHKEQMLKDAVEGEVIYDLGGFFRIKSEAIDGAKYKVGSWVKLIIVKED